MADRALLLTDLVDSTLLTERLGDAEMARLVGEHERVARDLLRRFGGREIDKADGFLLLFEQAPAAARYAIAYHEQLARLGLSARAGIHLGAVGLRQNAPDDVALGAKPVEVEGLIKSIAGRILAIAQGGQTLVSAEAAAALRNCELRLASHGHWRMKGIAEPVELFEVGDIVAPFTPPPDGPKAYRVVSRGDLWLPVMQVKHSLPTERDAFVGRKSDLQALANRLEQGATLVSVLGIGGTGKTRLVIRYGWSWLGEYPGGVWFCDLSEARTVAGVAYAVAQALEVPLGKDDPIVQLGHAIAGRGRCLVLLDNFEQVARHAAETIGHWLDRARDAQFVVTTREVLGLPGEEALALAPLPPSEGAVLFIARARSAKRDFEPDDLASIDALVKLLDGLPLAIELAAARVRVMPPKTLLHRMGERFQLLSSSGGRHTRQATMRATLDWSWDLLSPDEQQALGQLSVFEGGFTLAAAEAVLALEHAWPTDAVQALVDKSLVRQMHDDRFDLLVTVQEYAEEKRRAFRVPDEAEERHGAWFARFGTPEAVDSLYVHGGVARALDLSRELDNLVAACGRAVTRQQGAVAGPLLQAAWAVLQMRGPYAVGVSLAERVQALSLSAQDLASTRFVLGAALNSVGRGDEGRVHLQNALALAREAGNRRFEGRVLGAIGYLHVEQGRMDDGRLHLDAALAVAREVGDRRREGIALLSLGALHLEQGRMDDARAHYDAALAVAREIGDRWNEGITLGGLGKLDREQGRVDEARVEYESGLTVAREIGDRSSEGNLLNSLGDLLDDEGRMDEARTHYEAALAVAGEVGHRRLAAMALGNLGELHYALGRMDEARARYDAALVVARETKDRLFEGHVLGILGNLWRFLGEPQAAGQHLDDALALHREMGFTHGQPSWLGGLALIDADTGRHDAALARACEAVDVAAPFPPLQLKALGTLGRVHLARGDVAAAREATTRARALAPRGSAELAAVEALVAVAEGNRPAAEAALAEATADPARCMQGSEIALLVVQARAALAALDD